MAKEETIPKEFVLDLPGYTFVEKAAPVWKRISAFVIDIFILNFFVFSPFASIIKQSSTISSFKDLANLEAVGYIHPQTLMALFFISLFMFSYFFICEYFLGETFGKRLFGIYVRRIDKGKISVFQAIMRNIAVLPYFPFNILWIADPVLMALTGARLTDRMLKTEVVEKGFI